MSEQDPSGPAVPDEGMSEQGRSAQSAGAQLRAQREAYGWSVEDVAAQLNLAPRQVEAIESDNHAALPGMPITRGFIRAYAKLLRIDSAPLLTQLGGGVSSATESLAPRKSLATPFSETRLPSMGERKSNAPRIVAGLVLLALVGGAGWVWLRGAEFPQLPQLSSEPSSDTPAIAQPSADTAIEPLTSPTTVEVPPAESAPVVPAPAAPSPTAPVAAAQPVPAQPAPAPVTEAAASEAVQKGELRIRAHGESWIQIRRASNNNVVFSRLMKDGDTQTIEVTEALSVVVGNASGVELTLRGAPVQLKAGSGNVARLNLK